MEEVDVEFRIPAGDGEVPLLQHLLYPGSSMGTPSHHAVLPRRPDTPSPPPLPRTYTTHSSCPELKIYLRRAYILDETVHVLDEIYSP